MKKQLKLALINSAIAGALVFAGAFTDGNITLVGVVAALSASVIAFLTRMKTHFNKKGLKGGLFEFI